MPCPRTLRIPGRTSELARVRRCVSAWAAEAGLAEADARRLQLAVDETIANAIEHGMSDPEHGHVVVRATPGPGRLVVAIRHRGVRFDPVAAPTPAPADVLRWRAPHGYGLHLIRRLVDEVDYRFEDGPDGQDGTNEVRLTKRRGDA